MLFSGMESFFFFPHPCELSNKVSSLLLIGNQVCSLIWIRVSTCCGFDAMKPNTRKCHFLSFGFRTMFSSMTILGIKDLSVTGKDQHLSGSVIQSVLIILGTEWWSNQKQEDCLPTDSLFLLRVFLDSCHYLLCSWVPIETRRPRFSSPPEWKASSFQLNGILLRRSEIPNGQETKMAFSSTFGCVPARHDACFLVPHTWFMYSPLVALSCNCRSKWRRLLRIQQEVRKSFKADYKHLRLTLLSTSQVTTLAS